MSISKELDSNHSIPVAVAVLCPEWQIDLRGLMIRPENSQQIPEWLLPVCLFLRTGGSVGSAGE